MTVYTQTARFDNARALGEDEMRRIAPSIFALTAHDSRSERFQPIPTIDVLRGLQREGFHPVGVKQSRSREASKVDFTKHLIRLRRLDDGAVYKVGDTVCEILLKNANDGTSAYELMAGLFRIRCMNSLVAQTGTLANVKVRHSGDVAGKVIEGTYSVLDEARGALAAPADWGTQVLSEDERMVFARSAHMLRFGDTEGETATPIKAEQIIRPRRAEDRDRDLWTTFNVAQENCIRGGLHGVAYDDMHRRRRVITREIKGIDQDVKLNKALWMLAQGMANLKRAA